MIVADEIKALATIGDKLIDKRPSVNKEIILGLSMNYSNIKFANKTISCTLIRLSLFISDNSC